MNCNYCGHELAPFTKFCTRCGNATPQPKQAAYTPPPPASQHKSQPHASWGVAAQQTASYKPKKKSRVGKVLLILFSVVIVLAAGTGVAVYFGVKALKTSIKSSEAYQVAESELTKSQVVNEKLGEIKETGFPLGTYNENPDGTGNAAFTTTVQGTKASARYVVAMEKDSGTWRVTHAFLKIDGSDELFTISGDSETPSIFGEPPPPPAPPPIIETNDGPRTSVPTSGTILNDKAITKPNPTYPAIAKAARASGAVKVAVVVDKTGGVISANAVSGHPLLRQAAVNAARQAKFNPNSVPAREGLLTGILTYEFELE